MTRARLVVVLVLVAVACGDSGSSPTTTAADPDPPAETAPVTTVAPTTSAAPATTPPPTTTTTPTTTPPTTTTTSTMVLASTTIPIPEVPLGVDLSITAVEFGFQSQGYVEITNTGVVAGDTDGFWLCQRPNYYEIPSIALDPGQSVRFYPGDEAPSGPSLPDHQVEAVPIGTALGTFPPNSGELGLYFAPAFDDPSAIVSFVEWGSEGAPLRSGRSSVAIEAGIWGEGDRVPTGSTATGINTGLAPATSPGGWRVDF